MSKVLGLRNWWDQIDEYVILGALPFASDVPKLKSMGVRTVLNICEEYSGPQDAYNTAGIKQLRLPTIDYTSPSLETVQRGVAFIEECITQGDKVYVHCKAGRGRGATVVLCWLVKAKNLPPQRAMEFLLERRPQVNSRIHKSKEVREFIRSQLGQTLIIRR
jgi:atypical dual specificity phosphatase